RPPPPPHPRIREDARNGVNDKDGGGQEMLRFPPRRAASTAAVNRPPTAPTKTRPKSRTPSPTVSILANAASGVTRSNASGGVARIPLRAVRLAETNAPTRK